MFTWSPEQGGPLGGHLVLGSDVFLLVVTPAGGAACVLSPMSIWVLEAQPGGDLRHRAHPPPRADGTSDRGSVGVAGHPVPAGLDTHPHL